MRLLVMLPIPRLLTQLVLRHKAYCKPNESAKWRAKLSPKEAVQE